MRIGAHQGVRVNGAVLREQTRREKFQVELMQNPEAGRYQPYAPVCLRRPFHEAEALTVAFNFELHVAPQGLRRPVVIDGEGVIERHVDRYFGFHQCRRMAAALHGAAQGGEIAKERNARRAVQHDAAHDERDFGRALRVRLPAGQIEHVCLEYLAAIAIPEQRLEDDAQGYRQAGDAACAVCFERPQRKNVSLFTGPEVDILLAGGMQRWVHGRFAIVMRDQLRNKSPSARTDRSVPAARTILTIAETSCGCLPKPASRANFSRRSSSVHGSPGMP